MFVLFSWTCPKHLIKSDMKVCYLNLKQNGISGRLLNLLKNHLENRKQRVFLNGCESEWGVIKSGIPQGSVLGPLLFSNLYK